MGATPLGAKCLAHVAGFLSERCWQHYAEMAGAIMQRSGRHPHPESVGRVMRNLRRNGAIIGHRIGPGGRIRRDPATGVWWRTYAGCTYNKLNRKKLGLPRAANDHLVRTSGAQEPEPSPKYIAPELLPTRSRKRRNERIAEQMPARPTAPPPDVAERLRAIGLLGFGAPPPRTSAPASPPDGGQWTQDKIDRALADRDRERGPPSEDDDE